MRIATYMEDLPKKFQVEQRNNFTSSKDWFHIIFKENGLGDEQNWSLLVFVLKKYPPGSPLTTVCLPKISLLLFIAAQAYTPLSVFLLNDWMAKRTLSPDATTLYFWALILSFVSAFLLQNKYSGPSHLIRNQKTKVPEMLGTQLTVTSSPSLAMNVDPPEKTTKGFGFKICILF